LGCGLIDGYKQSKEDVLKFTLTNKFFNISKRLKKEFPMVFSQEKIIAIGSKNQIMSKNKLKFKKK